MRLAIEHCAVQLDGNALLAMRGARGARVECVAGTVWLTIAGQNGDFFLRPGDRLLIESNGLVVAEGLPQGALRVLCSETYKSAVDLAVGLAGGLAGASRPRRS
jgi:Protein of unknown function (DUF2917)